MYHLDQVGVVVDQEDDPVALVLELPSQSCEQIHDCISQPFQILLQLAVLQQQLRHDLDELIESLMIRK